MKDLIEGHSYEVDSIGCSDSYIYLFDHDLVLKIERKSEESNGQLMMLEWLKDKLPVPRLVMFYSDGQYNYLLMTRIKGKMACDQDILVDYKNLIRLLARGLKKLWKIDINGCPRAINLDYKLKKAYERVTNNLVDMDSVEPETFGKDGFKNPMELYEYLRDNRPNEEPVLIHGDYCLPNVFIDNNEISGYLDLGYCGVGDKWQDIALAVRSLKHNLQECGKENLYPILYTAFFEELGIEPDEAKIKYYILLDELF